MLKFFYAAETCALASHIALEESGIGGFGSHVATFLARHGLLDGKLKFRPLMIPDTFVEQSTQADMYAAAGLDRTGIVKTVLDTLGADIGSRAVL